MITPDDLTFGPDGALYFTDILIGQVRKMTPDGAVSIIASGLPGANPITFSEDGRLFVACDFYGVGLYEIDPNGVITKFSRSGSETLASNKRQTDGTRVPYFYHNDHLGGVNVITNINGTRVQLNEYDPWGGVSRNEGPTPGSPPTVDTTHRFTGQELDPETGLYYYGGRYYDAESGRFISPDPYVQAPEEPQNLNRYSYVLNNPVNLVDPNGHFFWIPAVMYAVIQAAIAILPELFIAGETLTTLGTIATAAQGVAGLAAIATLPLQVRQLMELDNQRVSDRRPPARDPGAGGVMAGRTPLVAGNWKMNFGVAATRQFLEALLSRALPASVEVVVCPPYVSLPVAAMLLTESGVALGAQNVHWEDKGAFTGEISAPMLKEAGARYCVVGHSERRDAFADTDERVQRKAKACLKQGISPIVCIGESMQERKRGQTLAKLEYQFLTCFEGFTSQDLENTVIEYEPIWAIGSGLVATPEQAGEAHQFIRDLIRKYHSVETASKTRASFTAAASK